MRIDLVGTTADFRRFGHPQTLPINHLLCENRRTQGRMGEVGLGLRAILLLSSRRRPSAVAIFLFDADDEILVSQEVVEWNSEMETLRAAGLSAGEIAETHS